MHLPPEGVGDLEAEGSPQPCRTLGNVGAQINQPPRIEDRAIPANRRVIVCFEGSSQHFTYGDRRSSELHPARTVGREERRKSLRQLRMVFEEIDDGRGIQQEQRLIRRVVDPQRSHSSRRWRIVRVLSFPHIPRPEPASGTNDAWRSPGRYSPIGTRTATGWPTCWPCREWEQPRRAKGHCLDRYLGANLYRNVQLAAPCMIVWLRSRLTSSPLAAAMSKSV
jgi:hypothetical protein